MRLILSGHDESLSSIKNIINHQKLSEALEKLNIKFSLGAIEVRWETSKVEGLAVITEDNLETTIEDALYILKKIRETLKISSLTALIDREDKTFAIRVGTEAIREIGEFVDVEKPDKFKNGVLCYFNGRYYTYKKNK